MSEYIITDKQLGLIQDFATVCVEGEKLPRIVRCRDCKHYARDPEPIDPGWPMMCEDTGRDMVEPDGFCAWGERREDG